MKLALLALGTLTLLYAASAAGSNPRPLSAPAGLHAFSLRADEPVRHDYSQLPAFAWAPVRGANHYEIQLATSVTFTESTVIADNRNVPTPVTSLQLQLPWMTGAPYALWVRTRAISGGTVSGWSKAFGFNTSWPQVPNQITQGTPAGLIRWTPVDGATAYDVWYQDLGIHVWTMTNVADEREYWAASNSPTTIHWRVRAVRFVWDPQVLPDQLPKISYGPYSQQYQTFVTRQVSNKPLHAIAAVSTAVSAATHPEPHTLTPGYAWTGSTGIDSERGVGWRVYVFSDKQCVNLVTVGSLVQSPAWAPRWVNPGWVPSTPDASMDGDDAGMMSDLTPFTTAEGAGGAAVAAATTSSSSSSSSGSSSTDSGSGAATAGPTPGTLLALPDLGWPSGRFWWTVVPVGSVPSPDGKGTVTKDLELPQDACERGGRVWSFGMQSMAATTQGTTPLASGFSGDRVVASASRVPSFMELPVIAWKPVIGAQSYEIQLSRRPYPWRTAIRQTSTVPSVTLRLSKANVGRWYYRVRGIDQFLPGQAVKMTWSKPASIKISGDRFVVVQ